MCPEERRHHILELLHQREWIPVDELAWTPSISQRTIRRDLTALAEQGLVSKFHGGAALPPSGGHENASQTRVNKHAQGKRVVTCYAAGPFGPDDSIFIDTGTTTLLFARELIRQSHLTVIANSLLTASNVGTSSNRVFMIGGEYRPESEQNAGALTIEQIARFNAEYMVVTVGTLSDDGAMDFSIEEAEITHATIAQTRQLTVITDSSKLSRRASFQAFSLSRINRLVVDRKPTRGLWEVLQQARVEIHEVPLCTPQA